MYTRGRRGRGLSLLVDVRRSRRRGDQETPRQGESLVETGETRGGPCVIQELPRFFPFLT